jgi:glycosyltransferase involved in cell wall biosynthesis
MEVSVIMPVLNSHEIVRRHILYWSRMDLPADVEIIIMDDGSDPPLECDTDVVKIVATGETRPWTSSIARNRGAEIAKGRNLIMVDGDYILPKQLFMDVREFHGNRMQFVREFGVLDEEGRFTQDAEVLFEYGLLRSRYKERKAKLPPHPNCYAMNRDVFFEIGGYDEGLVLRRRYPQGEDNLFKRRWRQWAVERGVNSDPHRPKTYMYPCGQFCGDVDYNPFGLFHELSRKTRTNVFWHRQLRREKKNRAK